MSDTSDTIPDTSMEDFKPIAPKYDSKLIATIGEELYLSRDLADVYFVFESNNEPRERVPAHKLLLKKGCTAFRAMFNGSWKEKNEVRIVDTSAAAFKEFLQFFYKGDVVLTAQNVAAVMNLGKQYVVDECVAMCTKYLKNTLDELNVCTRYGLAILYEKDELKKSCETIIGLKASAVFKSNEFLSCDRNILAAILRLDWLSCSEVELFEACMAWVKAISKREILNKKAVTDHLGDLLYEIRFGSMTFEEFVALVSSYGKAFSSDEYQDIIQMIGDEEFQAKMFNGQREKRCNADPWYEMGRIGCDRVVSDFNSSKPYFLQSIETTKFSVDQPLLLKKIICDEIQKFRDEKYFPMKAVPTEVAIVEVSRSGSSNEEIVLYSGKTNLQSKSRTSIALTKPIFVRPGFHYEIRMKQNPPENCCTGVLLKSIANLKCNATIQFHDCPTLDDSRNVPRGLIYLLRFHRI